MSLSDFHEGNGRECLANPTFLVEFVDLFRATRRSSTLSLDVDQSSFQRDALPMERLSTVARIGFGALFIPYVDLQKQ